MGGKLAKDDVIPYELGEEDLSLVDGGVQDEFGNEIFDGKSSDGADGQDSQGKEGENDDGTDQGGDDNNLEAKGDDKKHEESIPYERFDKVNVERNTFRDENLVLKANMDNLKGVVDTPEFKEYMANKMAGENIPKETNPDVGMDSFEFAGKTDSEISGFIVDTAVGQTVEQLRPILEHLSRAVSEISGSQTKVTSDKFFKDNTLATENREAIEALSTKTGLTLQQAYYAQCGDKIKDVGVKEGLQRKKLKDGKDVIGPASNIPAKSGKNKKYATVFDAAAESCRELGIDIDF